MKYACAMQSGTPQHLIEMTSCKTLHIVGPVLHQKRHEGKSCKQNCRG